MEHIKTIVSNPNMNVLHQDTKIKDECICRIKKYCTFGGKVFLPNIVCQEKITSTQPNYNDKVYFIVAEKQFKNSATKPNSFTHKDYASDFKLWKEYWETKRNNFIPKVTWSIVRVIRQMPPTSTPLTNLGYNIYLSTIKENSFSKCTQMIEAILDHSQLFWQRLLKHRKHVSISHQQELFSY